MNECAYSARSTAIRQDMPNTWGFHTVSYLAAEVDWRCVVVVAVYRLLFTVTNGLNQMP